MRIGVSTVDSDGTLCCELFTDGLESLASISGYSITIIMSKLHDFLMEHEKFPFPHPDELQSAGSTDMSEIEISLLERVESRERSARRQPHSKTLS